MGSISGVRAQPARAKIARAWQAGRGVPGVFNFCGRPATSWCGFARVIFARAHWAPTPEIEPIRTEDRPTPAARPANSVLDCAKIRAAYGIEQPDWRVSLDAILAEIREQGA